MSLLVGDALVGYEVIRWRDLSVHIVAGDEDILKSLVGNLVL